MGDFDGLDCADVARLLHAFLDHELTDADEQTRRFEADLARRRAAGLPEVPVDGRLLAALRAGLPPCAGVACGLDRMLLAARGGRRIDEVLAFPLERA